MRRSCSRRHGRELFYTDAGQRLVAVSVTTSPTFVPGSSTPLFLVTFQSSGAAYGYDVARDGQTFLVPLGASNGTTDSRIPLTVTTNWTSLLKK